MNFEDEGYRWREDEVDALAPAEARALLLRDAREEAEHNEFEVAYQILRELVWRFPDCSEAWPLLSAMAAKLGNADEAKAAAARSPKP
jgi:Flp pilus assembly protein TadD